MKRLQTWLKSLVETRPPEEEIAPKTEPRIRELAQMRGEDVDSLLRLRPDLQTQKIPKKISPKYMSVKGLEVEASGIEDDLPFIRLKSGRIFYGLPQPAKCGLVYDCLQDLLPENLKRECMLLALDVVRRYQEVKCVNLIPPGSEGIVEVGAYHGIKAIRFLDELGNSGRALAVEMMPENFGILQRNIKANNLGDRMQAVLAGAWQETKQALVSSNGYQRNSALPIDGREWSKFPSVEVQLETLDNIIEKYEFRRIDFVNLQINGAENEALKGLQCNIDRMGIIRIVAPYSREGQKSLPACEKTLEGMGCRVLLKRKNTLIAAPHVWTEESSWVRNLVNLEKCSLDGPKLDQS